MADAPALGRVLSAIVTPMRPDGSIDLDAAQRVATHLVDSGHDGLVVSGTTGESPTTSADEKDELLRAVIGAVGDRCVIIAGAGSNDTAKSVESVRLAQKAGADAVLAVTPYYNKPPQAGLVAHFTALADASDLPVMVYDIPGRSGIAIARETYLRIAEHDRITAVKDARGDLWFASEMMQETGLDWYSGDDAMNLAHFVNGAVGFVGVTSQVAPGGLPRDGRRRRRRALGRRPRRAPTPRPARQRRHERHPGRHHGQGRPRLRRDSSTRRPCGCRSCPPTRRRPRSCARRSRGLGAPGGRMTAP